MIAHSQVEKERIEYFTLAWEFCKILYIPKYQITTIDRKNIMNVLQVT